MEVNLLKSFGEEIDVVNAARVSFDKESKLKEGGILSERDQKLIKYLAENNHWTPFSHVGASFRIKAPIFVARQLWKSHVGSSGGDISAWNETSRRYVDTDPEFYVPQKNRWRKRAEDKKQGSGETFVPQLPHPEEGLGSEDLWGDFDNKHNPSLHVEYLFYNLKQMYQELIKAGVCPEQARMVLPQAMYTEWWWSGSLSFFSRVCDLRCDSHTQLETQEIANQISSHMEKLFPICWGFLRGKMDERENF
jgi:thymidylate synthase (FAD)